MNYRTRIICDESLQDKVGRNDYKFQTESITVKLLPIAYIQNMTPTTN